MRYFPVFVDLAGQSVVVVGGGDKAVQKLRLLLKTPAAITVICQFVSPELRAMASAQPVRLIEEPFAPHLLDGARLVFVAVDEPELAVAVSTAAAMRGIQVNVVDKPKASSFIVPAIVDRDPLVVAVGSEGTAPVLARNIRATIEALLPARIGEVARQSSALRDRVHGAVHDPVLRRRLWERLLGGDWRDDVLAGDRKSSDSRLEFELADAARTSVPPGRVSLVGAGPGDPDLLTLRAQHRLQEADVIVFDALVPDAILEHARRDAIRIFAGKEGYGVATDQAEINTTLVHEAAKGQKVVRLKGGDPFVFGRAAEEMAAVQAAGIPVDVVPGITAAHACAASIGLPLTLRGKVRQFSVVTGATSSGLPDLDWKALARPGHAFAIYMGVRSAPAITARLLVEGASPKLSVIVVENGTRPGERVLQTTLGGLSEALTRHAIKGPAIIFVGLDWADAHLSPPSRMVHEPNAERKAFPRNGQFDRRPQTPDEVAMTANWAAG
jgi:uroporphyrin-III C-methyltransferase / precorrin-2 dehydrogenase / sirohydrochlorin ferrochelatase